MPDFQSISLRRRVARVERSLAEDHDRAAQAADSPVQRQFHAEAAENCRRRAEAYETRAAREEAIFATEALR